MQPVWTDRWASSTLPRRRMPAYLDTGLNIVHVDDVAGETASATFSAGRHAYSRCSWTTIHSGHFILVAGQGHGEDAGNSPLGRLHSLSSAMPEPSQLPPAPAATPPWDARLARALVRPLRCSPISPHHLTTVRLAFGIAAAGAFMRGSYAWMNLGAVLLAVSNFLDHTDGELARISGKTSRVGHWYDLASDAVVTILLFTVIGVGVGMRSARVLQVPPLALGTIAGIAIVLIFFLRAHIEEMAGKAASKQASMGGFETEDLLYLLPLVTLCNGATPFLVAAAIGAPLLAVWG